MSLFGTWWSKERPYNYRYNLYNFCYYFDKKKKRKKQNKKTFLHFNIASPSVCPKKYIKYICFSTDCCFLMNNSNYLYSKLDFEISPFNVDLSFGVIVAQVAVFMSLRGYNFSESSWRHTLTAKTLFLCWLHTFCLLLIYNNES